ncbi:HEAT repeat-containing protein [Halogranum amylolyticum]|uniref:HEAT repeat-containing protein n=1 Tax=Halogranum amylolyticum TaxID=660520 RepID=A0A1H8UPW0_9EURY|nr:HEAT repeat domain-containing protein [Halogranum amylolyticum]SEP05239.1 HEAT repeat-containing protein [Halogranum amylolyticum]
MTDSDDPDCPSFDPDRPMDPEEAAEGPTDPRVHPEASPGFDDDREGLDEIEVSRDVTIGDASKRELSASDVAPLVDESVATKLEALTQGDLVERRRAALALAEADRSRPVVDALVVAGRTDDDSEVRQFAVEALGKLGGERSEVGALAIADDDDPWVRAEAIVTLDRLDRVAHAERIEDGLTDDHHAVRRNAAISLFKHRGEAMCDTLLEQTEDPSERVREWATHLLAGVDDDRAESRLEEIAADDTECEIVRRTAVHALQTDAGKFRRQFRGALDETTQKLPGEDPLNRQPEL